MIDFDHGLSPEWQAKALLWMTAAALQLGDPDDVVRRWFDAAEEPDEQYLAWAIAQWRELSGFGVWDLERVRDECRTWLREHAPR